MPGPHFISPKPDKARASFVPKPAGFFESPDRLGFKELKKSLGFIENCKSPTGLKLFLAKPGGLEAQKCHARLESEPVPALNWN